jgi:hypothetical protein
VPDKEYTRKVGVRGACLENLVHGSGCSGFGVLEQRLGRRQVEYGNDQEGDGDARACQGVIFARVGLVKELIKKTATSKGLQVAVEIIGTVYQTGRKVAEDFKSSMRIVLDSVLPLWNCRVVLNQTCV